MSDVICDKRVSARTKVKVYKTVVRMLDALERRSGRPDWDGLNMEG